MPFEFKTVTEWERVLLKSGFRVNKSLVAGFEPGRMHKSCHVWLLCERNAEGAGRLAGNRRVAGKADGHDLVRNEGNGDVCLSFQGLGSGGRRLVAPLPYGRDRSRSQYAVSGQDFDAVHRPVVTHDGLERNFTAGVGLRADRIHEFPGAARNMHPGPIYRGHIYGGWRGQVMGADHPVVASAGIRRKNIRAAFYADARCHRQRLRGNCRGCYGANGWFTRRSCD